MTGASSGDVVVVLPGILGSRLRRDDLTTWGFGQAVRNLWQLSERLTADLALDGDAFEDHERGCVDGTEAVALMGVAGASPPAQLAAAIPGFWSILGGYGRLVARLERALGAREVIVVPYDWRQSCRVSARHLQQRIEPLISERRRTHPKAQLVLVGHSFGGLVARYYAECLDRHRYTGRIVTIGTPFQGAVKALCALANGEVRLSAGAVNLRLAVGELLRSLPSVAELLPSYPCLGDGLSELVGLDEGTTVPGLPDHLREHGLAFRRELDCAVAANGDDRPVYSPILGMRQATAYGASIGPAGLEPTVATAPELAGDGTVVRASAIPPEWRDRGGGAFACGRHAALQQADDVWAQLHGALTGEVPRRSMAPREELSVEVPEVALPEEPWTVTVRAASGESRLALIAEVVGEDGRVVASAPLPPSVDGYSASLTVKRPGVYCWEVRADPHGNTPVSPISDVMLCMAP